MSTPPTNNNGQINSATTLPIDAMTAAFGTPTLTALTVEGRLPSGVIPTALLYQPLKVFLDTPWTLLPQLGESDFFVVVWEVEGNVPFPLPARELVGPITAKDFPLELSIPASYLLNNARVRIYYRIHNLYEDAQVFEFSHPVDIIIDRRPPAENEVLKAPWFVDDDITESDATDNATFDVVVPGDYSGRAALDKIYLYLMDTNAFPVGLPILIETFAATTGAMVLKVPAAEIRKFAGTSPLYACYKVMDEAGNITPQFSLFGSTKLSLEALPADLPVPTVPAFDFDRLINREDARNIVSFGISTYTHYRQGDLCIPVLAGVEYPAIPVMSLPFTGTLSWQQLIANGANLQRKDNVPFRYLIRRASNPTNGGTPSPLKLINMDFTVFGRDHNQAPALLNLLLDKVNIFGAESNTANQLDSRDNNQPCRAEVLLSGDPQVGNMLSLYVQGQTNVVTTYTVKKGDVAGTNIIFDNLIPWSVIQSVGNKTALFYYLSTNGVNQQQSADQPVAVNITPPTVLSKPTYPHADDRGFITCRTDPPIWEGLTIRVIPGSKVLPGDILTLAFVGYLIPLNQQPIKSTEHTMTHRWDATQTFHDFVITDYKNYLQPLKAFASAGAKYSVIRNSVLIGVSETGYVRVDRKHSTGFYCTPTGKGVD
ncbi:hypothetical protein AOA59_23420 [Pseudomonas sp. 2822-15]|uniref:hypothetical protein n=1 Tax=Pseudomonas sp. 2822-15 TaxID=1712677 RepID=UPI000C146116|nr:hypothetical protein [Pseudomonas sp. 2822-15]PIB42298.1 hypothetical protein AOA59_23420 [Pseudomonas sp. 2822-15]